MLKVREEAVKTHSEILRRVSSCSPDPYTWFFHCHLLSQSHGQTKTLLWPGDTSVLADVETPGHLLPRQGLQPFVPVYRVLLLSLVQRRSHSEAREGDVRKPYLSNPKRQSGGLICHLRPPCLRLLLLSDEGGPFSPCPPRVCFLKSDTRGFGMSVRKGSLRLLCSGARARAPLRHHPRWD